MSVPDATWHDSGLRYCVTHNGVVECDEDEPCDFARGNDHQLLEHEQFDCLLRPLCYQKPAEVPA